MNRRKSCSYGAYISSRWWWKEIKKKYMKYQRAMSTVKTNSAEVHVLCQGMFVQRPECSERVSHVAIRGRAFQE